MRRLISLLPAASLLAAAGAWAQVPTPSPMPTTPKYHVIKKIVVGGDGGWDLLAVDSVGKRLYISHATKVVVIDLEKDVVAGEIADTPGVHGIAIDSAAHRGYTTNGGDNTVTVFDTETLKPLERVKVGARPDAIIYDRSTKRVFTFNASSNDATAIDTATNKVVGTIALGGKPELPQADGRGTVFVNLEDKSEIVAFDGQALTVKSRGSLAPGQGPTGLAFDRRNHRLFAVCDNDRMAVVDSDTLKVIATPAIGKGPDGCAFDRLAGFVFSSNGADGTLTVIKAESPDRFVVVDTIPTEKGARTMALDPMTHLIYMATAKFQPAPAPELGAPRRRPDVEPGSFAILVVGP